MRSGQASAVGVRLDEAFLDYLLENGHHPLGEWRASHTMTVDGPLFDYRVPIRVTGRRPGTPR